MVKAKKYHFIQWNMGQHDLDPGIRALNRTEEFIWWKMCCLMQESEVPGYLILAGKPTPLEVIAKASKSEVHEVKAVLKRLAELKIYSRDKRGIIFCRRMVRDEDYRAKASKFGKKGGNPALVSPKTSEPKGIKSHGGQDKVLWNGLYYFPSQLQKILDQKMAEVQQLEKAKKGQLDITNTGSAKAKHNYDHQISLRKKQIAEIELKLNGSLPLDLPFSPPPPEQTLASLKTPELKKRFREAGDVVESIINPPSEYRDRYYNGEGFNELGKKTFDRWTAEFQSLQRELERRKPKTTANA